MKIIDIIQLAIRTLQANLLRSVLTLSIIAIGITALIGILTSIDVLQNVLTKNFAELGANTFIIQNESGLGRSETKNAIIDYKQVEKFIAKYKFPSVVAVEVELFSSAVVKSTYKESDPNVEVVAVNGNYMKVKGKNIWKGRSFSNLEIENGSNVCIIGYDLAYKNFEKIDSIVGQSIRIENKPYRIIGISEMKGTTAGSNDNFALIPYLNAKKEFDISKRSFQLLVAVNDLDKIDWAIDEALGLFRAVRGLTALDEDDFTIAKSDKLANTLISQMQYISISTIIIGMLTLIGAGVGLMNIMLVSVNERTREIGLAKSLGARKSTIFKQFLAEAILLCLFGAMAGIILGVVLGNILSILLKSGFLFPWKWVLFGLLFSTFIGILAGLFPAIKAGRLNPVEALRHT